MTSETKTSGRDLAALICAIWFALTAWMWGYLANLVIAYPIGLLGLFLWYRGRKSPPISKLNHVALGCLVFGMISSIAVLFMYK